MSNGGTSRIAAGYAPLVAGDLSGVGGDQLIIDTSVSRVGANTTLILNAVPEPGTIALLALGTAMILPRRRETK